MRTVAVALIIAVQSGCTRLPVPRWSVQEAVGYLADLPSIAMIDRDGILLTSGQATGVHVRRLDRATGRELWRSGKARQILLPTEAGQPIYLLDSPPRGSSEIIQLDARTGGVLSRVALEGVLPSEQSEHKADPSLVIHRHAK